MKASEAIKQLTELIAKHGDLELSVWDHYDDDLRVINFEYLPHDSDTEQSSPKEGTFHAKTTPK